MTSSKAKTAAIGFVIGALTGVIANIFTGWVAPQGILGAALVGMLVAYAYTSRNEL